MMQENHEFQVSAQELDYLKQLVSHDYTLAGLLISKKVANGHKITIRLGRAEAEQLRDYLTTRLSRVGFNKDYSPNEQGRLLENLIDRFYLR
jgi:hypothetical protein